MSLDNLRKKILFLVFKIRKIKTQSPQEFYSEVIQGDEDLRKLYRTYKQENTRYVRKVFLTPGVI